LTFPLIGLFRLPRWSQCVASLHPIFHHIEKSEPERKAAGTDPLKKRKWGREIESRMSVIPPKERLLGRQGALARRQKPNTKT
jgi:hypothetical protein